MVVEIAVLDIHKSELPDRSIVSQKRKDSHKNTGTIDSSIDCTVLVYINGERREVIHSFNLDEAETHHVTNTLKTAIEIACIRHLTVIKGTNA